MLLVDFISEMDNTVIDLDNVKELISVLVLPLQTRRLRSDLPWWWWEGGGEMQIYCCYLDFPSFSNQHGTAFKILASCIRCPHPDLT